jgi:cytochrome c oxidase subunit 2
MHTFKTLLGTLLLTALSTATVAQQYDKLDLSKQPLANEVCATCHGGAGQGNPVVGGPSLAGLEPWYLRTQLENFRAGIRGSQKDYMPGNEMQASVAKLSDQEINDLVDQIANWEVIENDHSVTGDIAKGETLYAACGACHGAAGEGNQALGAPGLAGRNDWYMFRQIKLFKSGYRGSHPDDTAGKLMRPSVQALQSDDDINAVLAYINTLN